MLVCAAPCDMPPSVGTAQPVHTAVRLFGRRMRPLGLPWQSARARSLWQAPQWLARLRCEIVCVCLCSAPCKCPPSPNSSGIRAQAPNGDPVDEVTVRTVFHAHFERGGSADYVQLKDVAEVLEAHQPTCHQRLCYKTGTRVPSNEALAVVVSRVTGLQVQNAQVTMSGQVKVRGPIRGFRKVRLAA